MAPVRFWTGVINRSGGREVVNSGAAPDTVLHGGGRRTAFRAGGGADVHRPAGPVSARPSPGAGARGAAARPVRTPRAADPGRGSVLGGRQADVTPGRRGDGGRPPG